MVTPFSQTWDFHGVCDGTDQVTRWTVYGGVPTNGWQITQLGSGRNSHVFGAEITKYAGGPTIWWMIGNLFAGDSVMHLGPSEDQGRLFYPAGVGIPVPYPPDGRYFDLHGACSDGGPVGIFVTLYYVYD